MNLQTRILLAYGYLVILVVVGAMAAAVGFRELGVSVESVLGENFESVQASISMLESLERQDSALLSALLGEPEARQDLAEAERTFLQALERARNNVTIEGEADLLDALSADFDSYREHRIALVEEAPEQPLVAYEVSTYSAFERVKDRILELVDANHQAMREADVAVQRSAATRAALHGLLVALAVLSLAPLVRSIRVNVLNRIHELAAVASSIAGGDRRRRATADQDDELGLVARQFNAVLDQLQRAEAEAAGETARDRQLLRALLEQLGAPAALARGDGRLVASTLDPELLQEVAVALDNQELPDDERSLHVAGAELRVFRLDHKGRSLGLLLLQGEASGDGPPLP